MAYSSEDIKCPSNLGPTWKSWDSYANSWVDAGESLLTSCYYSNCTQDSPCSGGHGDCDDDIECQGSLVCGTINCASGPAGLDCCTSACHNDSDCMNQECNTDLNHCRLDSFSTAWSNCSDNSPCSKGEGDCDHDSECLGSLVCNEDSCINGTKGMDCCGPEIDKGNKSCRPHWSKNKAILVCIIS